MENTDMVVQRPVLDLSWPPKKKHIQSSVFPEHRLTYNEQVQHIFSTTGTTNLWAKLVAKMKETVNEI